MENWQSEFLQFSLFIAATIWLVQKGSNQSKALEDAGLESDEQQQIGLRTPTRGPRWAKADDVRTRIYENSLLIVMTLIFFATWFAQSLNNWRVFNEEQATHGAGTRLLGPIPARSRLLGEDPPELAVGVPRRRHARGLHDLPAPARLSGIEACRCAARRDGNVRLAPCAAVGPCAERLADRAPSLSPSRRAAAAALAKGVRHLRRGSKIDRPPSTRASLEAIDLGRGLGLVDAGDRASWAYKAPCGLRFLTERSAQGEN